jgi:hypothetical protein
MRRTYAFRVEANKGVFDAACTIIRLWGCANDRMYGCRHRYSSGILAGSMDKSVGNIGRVW